ncbi:MAG: response regulator [Magnetococcales bacterium]|nr:response regulator [Magnetococcales bacterium]MBF0148742.1 response regulator [Magnetococcales bacterium]MBF0173765.1 response regulator [Magnetococcales bacterium]MBF0348570.1 response regulator [Magnetococcales bacterium]MBF0630293.1 response regulator [Magnetococcales bacterium]
MNACTSQKNQEETGLWANDPRSVLDKDVIVQICLCPYHKFLIYRYKSVQQILIVDDDKSVLFILREWLEMDGYKVHEADNVEHGSILFSENPIVLVITDILMPEKDGVEFIAELKLSCRDVKIVSMSGGGNIIDRHLCLRIAKSMGVVEQLNKPLVKENVLKVVHSILD